MREKPTYEELEQRVHSLEKKLADDTDRNDANLEHQYLEAILNNSNLPIFLKDANYKYIFMNQALESLTHMSCEQIRDRDDFALFSEPVAQLFRSQDEEVIRRRTPVEFEETVALPDGGTYSFITSKFPLLDGEGKVYAVGGLCTDITARKKAEADLQEAREVLRKAHDHLEQRVAERTAELGRRTEKLIETNVALKVLLEKREEDKKELEEKVLANVEKLILPSLEKLLLSCDKPPENTLLKIIRTNLEEITSSFSHRNRNDLEKLTPAQIQIANLIKQGHTTKEIAALLKLSPSTIACHRQDIRKRLSLTNKKINLQASLASQP